MTLSNDLLGFFRSLANDPLRKWLEPYLKLARQVQENPEHFSEDDQDRAQWIEAYLRDARDMDSEWKAIAVGRAVHEAMMILAHDHGTAKAKAIKEAALAEVQKRGQMAQSERKKVHQQRARAIYEEMKREKPNLNILSAHPDIASQLLREGITGKKGNPVSYAWLTDAINAQLE